MIIFLITEKAKSKLDKDGNVNKLISKLFFETSKVFIEKERKQVDGLQSSNSNFRRKTVSLSIFVWINMNFTHSDGHACITGLLRELQEGRTSYLLLALTICNITTASIAFWLNNRQQYQCLFFKRIMSCLFLCIFSSTTNCLVAHVILILTNIPNKDLAEFPKQLTVAWVFVYIGITYKSLISWHILVVGVNRLLALYFPLRRIGSTVSSYTFWFLVFLCVCHAGMAILLSVIDLIYELKCTFAITMSHYVLLQNCFISLLVLFLYVAIATRLIFLNKARRKIFSLNTVATENRTVVFCIIIGVSYVLGNGPVSLQALSSSRAYVSVIFLNISVCLVDPLLYIAKIALEKKFARKKNKT